MLAIVLTILQLIMLVILFILERAEVKDSERTITHREELIRALFDQNYSLISKNEELKEEIKALQEGRNGYY